MNTTTVVQKEKGVIQNGEEESQEEKSIEIKTQISTLCDHPEHNRWNRWCSPTSESMMIEFDWRTRSRLGDSHCQ